jgi:hypothetical protein
VAERSAAEDAVRAAARRRAVRWAIGAGVGLPVLLVLVVVVVGAGVAAYLGGAGSFYTNAGAPPIATPAIRAAAWVPSMPAGAVPAAVLAGVVAHESGGAVLAAGYNCSNGQSAGEVCSQAFPAGVFGLGGAHTLSEDAGLGQINSGGWPVPPAPGWTDRGLAASDPFAPHANLVAAERVLGGDLAQCGGLLLGALEAYNSGRCAGDSAYAAAVVAEVQALQAGPEVAAWSVVWSKKRAAWLASGGATWVIVGAVAPAGARWVVPYSRSRVCSTVSKGKTRCRETTADLTGRALTMPTAVTVSGRRAAELGTEAAAGCPAWPGEAVWCAEVPGPGMYTVTARWPHGKSAAATITLEGDGK